MSEPTALERAVGAAELMDDAETHTLAIYRAARAQAWALISIAESLETIAGEGIETYELDADGHRRYQ